MIVEFDKSFEKSVDRLKNQLLNFKISNLIESVEAAESISELIHVKKLSGYKTYFRYRVGDYRIGFEKINEKTIRFIVIAHRKDIYKVFP